MGVFHGTILIRRISTGRIDVVAKLLEESANLGIVVHFAALIQMDVLIGNLRSMRNQPLLEPVDQGTFSDANSAIECTSEVVFDHGETSFTIETLVGGSTGFVFGCLTSECKINR